jgi:hypothetical protein
MPKQNLTRRTFITGAALAVGGAGAAMWLRPEQRRGAVLSAFEDARGDQYVGGLSLGERRVFGARVPMRAHGCAIDPRDSQRVLYFARRPGVQAFELDRRSMRVRTAFATPAGRHLAGHGVFSADGELLFTPEHDYENIRGVIAVRSARTFAIVNEIDTHGIDPHEIAWAPDRRTLLVANGGILTHPRTFRRKLNIRTMDPSLCLIDAVTGECRDQQRLPDHLLSIRHLALSSSGTAAIGLQYEGACEHAPGVVALLRPQSELRLLTAPAGDMRRFAGYVASVAVSDAHDLIAAACPYGAGIACWSLSTERYLGFVEAREAYGLSRLADGSLIASQRDGAAFEVDERRLRPRSVKFDRSAPIRWDDHWVSVEEA